MSDIHDLPINDDKIFISNPNFISIPLASKSKAGGKGRMTLGLTFTKDYGKNVVISDTLHKAIGSPEQVQIAILDGKLAIGAFVHDSETFYSMRNQKKHKVIYNTVLINSIVDYFKLDYSNCTRKTFDEIDFIEVGINNIISKVALVNMEDKK